MIYGVEVRIGRGRRRVFVPNSFLRWVELGAEIVVDRGARGECHGRVVNVIGPSGRATEVEVAWTLGPMRSHPSRIRLRSERQGLRSKHSQRRPSCTGTSSHHRSSSNRVDFRS